MPFVRRPAGNNDPSTWVYSALNPPQDLTGIAAGSYEVSNILWETAVTVSDPAPTAGTPVFRMNGSMGIIPAIDGQMDWAAFDGTKISAAATATTSSQANVIHTSANNGRIAADQFDGCERVLGNSTLTLSGLAAGSYEVWIYQAETFFTAVNRRVFDITIGGTLVADDLDPFVAYGGRYIVGAVNRTVTIATGENVTAAWAKVIDNPTFLAIEVLAV